jgi:hypothetical protein
MPKRTPSLEETRTEEKSHSEAESSESVAKIPAMAEIVQFPEGKDTISGVSQAHPDSQTKTRWLQLADEVLGNNAAPKRA